MKAKLTTTEAATMLAVSESAVLELVTRGLLHPANGEFEASEVAALGARLPTPRGCTLPGDAPGRFITRSMRTPAT